MENQLVYSLPDSYAKPVRFREAETSTNTWRLFSIVEGQADNLRKAIQDMKELLDIDKCTGDALCRLGEMYGVAKKSQMDDNAYRTEILAKITGYFSDTSANSVLTAISISCGLAVGDIYLREIQPATVQVHIRNQSVIQNLPISIAALCDMIQEILAVGVRIDGDILIDDVLCFCSIGEEQIEELNGTGYNETAAGFGSVMRWEELN